MSAIGNILVSSVTGPKMVTGSATVATDTTYAPERFLDKGVARWVNRAGGIPLVYPWLTLQVRPPTSKESTGVYKVSMKAGLPIAETIDPAVGIFGPRVAYELQCHMDFLLPARATQAERALLTNIVRSLLFASIEASDGSPADVTASPLPNAIGNLEDVY
jgi:hypothetical protein